MAVSGWITNLARRLSQLDRIAMLDNISNVEVWLGGLFFPEAYITATRQAVAHRKKWSLETLSLRLDIERVNDRSAFVIDGEDICFLSHLCVIFNRFPQVWHWKARHGQRTDCF
jgi:dynein heavy chain 1, cytosolic